MKIRNQLLALAVTAGLSAAPASFAQVDETAPQPSSPAATAEPTPPLQNNSPADSAPADAAPGADAAASTAEPATGAPIDDQKIEQFASAYAEVATIQRNASAELEKTGDTTKVEEVKANAESQMIAAVERNGLDVNEFNRIVETMAADANVRSRVAAELQERSPTGPESGPAP